MKILLQPVLVIASILYLGLLGEAMAQTFSCADLYRDTAGYSYPKEITAWGDKVFCTGRDSAGFGVFISDGTPAGSQKLGDFAVNSFAMLPTLFNGKMLFWANGLNDTVGHDLWASDGTRAGTQPVADVTPGRAGFGRFMQPFRGELYFFANDSLGTKYYLWATDGTPAGTRMIRMVTRAFFPDGGPGFFLTTQSSLYFFATDSTYGKEIWVTDGTPAGTHLAADLTPGPRSSFLYTLGKSSSKLVALRSDTATDIVSIAIEGDSLNFSAINLLERIRRPSPNFYPVVRPSVPYAGKWYYTRSTSPNTYALCRTDGTAQGTEIVHDFGYYATDEGNPLIAGVFGNRLYLQARKNVRRNWELMVMDSTLAAPTWLDLLPGDQGSYPNCYNPMDTVLYLRANTATGNGLVRLNLGNHTLTPLSPSNQTNPWPMDIIITQQIVRAGNSLFFMANYNDTTKYELWRYTLPAAPVGVKPAKPTGFARLYPNPAYEGKMWVSVDGPIHPGCTVSVTDLSGRQLATYPISSAQTLLRLPVAARGVLVVEIRNGEKVQRERVVAGQ